MPALAGEPWRSGGRTFYDQELAGKVAAQVQSERLQSALFFEALRRQLS